MLSGDARVTLADIARAAGVTKTTVSRALRGDPRISSDTRGRIMRQAEGMGYRRDASLAAIAALRWRTRQASPGSVLVSLIHAIDWFEPVYLRMPLFDGVREACQTMGYHHEVMNCCQWTRAAALEHVLRSRGVAGLLVHEIYRADLFAHFDWTGLPAVSLGLGVERGPHHLVWHDPSWLPYPLASELAAAGVKRLHCVLLDAHRDLEGQHRAMVAHLRDAAARVGDIQIESSFFPAALGDKPPPAFRDWLRAERPAAILGFNNTVYWWCRTLGLQMPEDVRFASMFADPTDSAAALITGVDTRQHVQGRVAVELVDWLIRSHRGDPPSVRHHLLVEAAWHRGKTLGLD